MGEIKEMTVSHCKITGKWRFATVKLLSRAKSLKTNDATVKSAYRGIELLSQSGVDALRQ